MRKSSRSFDSSNRYSVRITPLIDVIFLLMIFFLLTLNFQIPEGVLNNQLPQLGSESSSDPTKDWETVRLTVKLVKGTGQMKILLQERAVSNYTDLLSYLEQLPDDILLIIDPESNVPFKDVIGVYNTCLKSDKTDIVFSISS